MKDFMPPIPRYVAPPEGPQDPLTKRFPLQLSGWHSKCRTHTVHDNNLNLRKLDPQKLWIHPEDAAARSINDGDMVLVYNDRGQVKIPAKITDRVAKGVTTLSQGTWYTPDENGVDTRGSINVLTSQRPTPYNREMTWSVKPERRMAAGTLLMHWLKRIPAPSSRPRISLWSRSDTAGMFCTFPINRKKKTKVKRRK